MALVLMEGFDNLSAAQFGVKQNRTINLALGSFVSGRFGGQAASLQTGSGGGGPKVTCTLPSTYSTFTCGFAARFGVLNTTFAIFSTNAGALFGYMLITAGGIIQFYNVSNTLLASGTTVLAAGAWHYIEAKIVINGASGSVAAQLDGASEIATTTANIGSTNIGQLVLGWNAATNTTVAYDDVYGCDTSGGHNTTFLGDVRVATVYPNADGAHTQWTATGGGAHYTQVNEQPANDDTTYVSDANPGDIDSYAFQDIDGGASVFGVQTNLYARKDDANLRQIAPVVRQGGTDYVGSTVTLGSSYADYIQLYDQDPTAANWTAANVNADEFGVKEIA